MEDLIAMYAGFAKVTAEREKIRLQRDMSKTLTASQQVSTFMDFFTDLKAMDESEDLDHALEQYNKIVNAIK